MKVKGKTKEKGLRVIFKTKSVAELRLIQDLEESLLREGVAFDVELDIERRLREWRLDDSLRGPLNPSQIVDRLKRSGAEFRVRKDGDSRFASSSRVSYREGDLILVPVGKGTFGLGRILLSKPPQIFVEFYPKVTRQGEPPSVDDKRDWILRIWCGDLGLTRLKTWKIVGHTPIEKDFKMPQFWHSSPLDGRLFLRSDAFHSTDQRPTTLEEIEKLRAQPDGLFGYRAAELKLEDELKKRGLI